MGIAVLRAPIVPVRTERLATVLAECRGVTKYKKWALRNEAPGHADCVTAAAYVSRRVWDLTIPRALIGDLPRELVRSGWTIDVVAQEKLAIGDWIFCASPTMERLVTHVVLVVGPNEVFHCKEKEGAVITTVDRTREEYIQKLQMELPRYIDPRGNRILPEEDFAEYSKV